MTNLFNVIDEAYKRDTNSGYSVGGKYDDLLPNEQRKILADYLKGLSQKQTEAGKRESMSDDADTLMAESKDLRQNKVKNRMQQFKDAYGKPDLNDFEFEQFMNSDEAKQDPDLQHEWFNDTLETRTGKDTYANRLHNMNLHENSLYNRTTTVEGLNRFSLQGAENLGEKLGGTLGIPYAATEDDAAKEGIDNPYEQSPFLSLGKDLVNTALLVGAPEIRGLKWLQGLRKGAAVGAGAGAENSLLGTEAEDYEHNPYLYTDKAKDLAVSAVGGGLLGLASNVAGDIKAIPSKLKKAIPAFLDKDRYLSLPKIPSALETSKVGKPVTKWNDRQSAIRSRDDYKSANDIIPDEIPGAANELANDPEFLNAKTDKDQMDMIYRKATENADKTYNRKRAVYLGSVAQKNYQGTFPVFPKEGPIIKVASRVSHNVPYYIAGNNPDFSEGVATEVIPKLIKKSIPGAEKVPYYLQKQE